jgi:hypothetical protein
MAFVGDDDLENLLELVRHINIVSHSRELSEYESQDMSINGCFSLIPP